MKPNEVLSEIISSSDFSQAEVARAVGVTPQALNYRVTKTENPMIASFMDVIDVLGYQLVVTRKGAKLPTGSIVVEQ